MTFWRTSSGMRFQTRLGRGDRAGLAGFQADFILQTRELAGDAIDIVILAVPAEAVPGVLDRVIAAGVKGILNFAPMQLRVPADVAVQDVNMVMELEALSFALSQAKAARE